MLRFTTNAYPKEQRWDSWRFALQRKSLRLEAMNAENTYGELSGYQSGQGLDFISISSTPQILKIDMLDQPDHIWLIQLLEGDLKITHGMMDRTVREGDIVFGDGNVAALLDFHRDHRFLLIKVPKTYLSLRVRHPLPNGVNLIASDTGAGRILSGMLRSVADTINDLNTDRIRPVELSLPEFLLTALMEGAPSKSLGGSAGARAMLLERVFQTIEMHLSDPNLNLQQVASEHGISMRYLQKLFETVNESFGHYVKIRRLERCRMDLLSPLHAQKSISDILFQWGFNDSASFSRAFREQYGVSPREYRKSPPNDGDVNEIPRRGRPTLALEQRADKATEVDDDDIDEIEAAVPQSAQAEAMTTISPVVAASVRHHYLAATPETVHWGHLSRNLKPALKVQSGDYVTVNLH